MIGLLFASLFPMTPLPAPPLIYIALQKPVLTLYYSNHCPYSQKVLRYLNQIHKSVPMKNVENNPAAKEELKEGRRVRASPLSNYRWKGCL